MLSEATSGLNVSAGFTRSCTVMYGAPPVVRLTTALVACLMRGRKRAKASGLWSGRPVVSSRACRCTMAAPASAAPIAASAISSAVTGRWGDIDGVWIAPVTAQVMMTLLLTPCRPPVSSANVLVRAPLVRGERHQAAVAPGLALDEPVGGNALAPLAPPPSAMTGPDPIDAPLHRRKYPGVDLLIALGVIAHAAGRVEIDGLERPHEAPAQRQPLADADIDVLDARIAVGDQAERLLQQRALKPVHHEAVDLALHHDGRVAGRAQEGGGALDHGGVRPRRRHDLRGGDEIRRIDGMDDEAARAARQMPR